VVWHVRDSNSWLFFSDLLIEVKSFDAYSNVGFSYWCGFWCLPIYDPITVEEWHREISIGMTNSHVEKSGNSIG